MIARKVKHMQLHSAMSIPNGLSLGRTVNDIHHKNVEMELHPLGVLCRYKGEEFIIAIVNIQCLTLEASNAKKA